ncbi:MAG: hypothetical protein Q8R98_19750, partial [Rubrivivax sp.]|nr:hypothetical protein [Rubrivivax sp.]
MATFPTVKLDWRTFSDKADSVVARAPMERGRPKQRRTNSDARVEMQMTLHFDTKAELAAFESWFDVDIKAGQDSFDMNHPRTGAAIVGRIVGGELGAPQY